MQLEIPAGEFDGFIYDCDGTLADSMPVHYHAWCRAIEKFTQNEKSMPEELFYHLGGVPTRRVAEIVAEELEVTYDANDVAEYKEQEYLNLLHTVKPIEPVLKHAREQAAAGRLIAVASGGMPHVVKLTLEIIKARELFSDDLIVTAADVEHGKPAPDMFLLAAKRINTPPASCLVFEDGEMGFRAATAAGMAYVRVASRGID